MRKQNKEYAKYTVVRDTREKVDQGWHFPESERCAGTLIQKLDVGDYSLLGFEKLVTIERKGSVSEFCGNLTQSRFVGEYIEGKELDKQSEILRLEGIQWPFILLEFEIDDLFKYPYIHDVPVKLRRDIIFKGPAAVKKVLELQMRYKTRIIFCGNRAKDVASSIFKRVVEEIERTKNG